MRTVIDPAAVLEIENDPQLQPFREPLTGVPVWLMVRNYFVRCIIEGLMYTGEAYRRYEPAYRSVDLLGAAAASLLHNLRVRPQPAPVLVLGSGAGVTDRAGERFDRLTSYYTRALGDFGWSELGIHAFNRRNAIREPRTTLNAHRRLIDHTRARLAVRATHEQLAAGVLDCAVAASRCKLDWAPDAAVVARIRRRLAIELAGAPQTLVRVDQMQREHRPRVLVADQSSYGTKAIFNAACRDRGIEVVEYQHGVITRAHEAYNLGQAWLELPGIERVLPSALLLYGPWWGSQINLPVRKVVIGNPHREASFETGQRPTHGDGEILVLGDGIDTAFYENFCAELARALPEHRIVFRPHPVERMGASERHERVGPAYRIDLSSDIYAAFGASSWVVSEVSTGLFEASGTEAKPVVISTEKSRFYLADAPFQRVANPAELALLVRGGSAATSAVREEDFWAPNWRSRFDEFIRPYLT